MFIFGLHAAAGARQSRAHAIRIYNVGIHGGRDNHTLRQWFNCKALDLSRARPPDGGNSVPGNLDRKRRTRHRIEPPDHALHNTNIENPFSECDGIRH